MSNKKKIKVVAIRTGYYALRRRKPGHVFFITDEKHFSKNWMKKAPAKAVAEPEPVFEEIEETEVDTSYLESNEAEVEQSGMDVI